MCSGSLTHTILPAELVALYVFRLSNPYNINSFASHFILFSLLSSLMTLGYLYLILLDTVVRIYC